MTHLGPVLVAFILSLVSPAAREIDRTFLRGDADGLRNLIVPGSYLNVSFSSPVAFSDILSDEQAVLWFRKLFRTHRTLGFYPDVPLLDRGSLIYKARWEVETPDRRQLAYDVLFLIRLRPSAVARQALPRARRGGFWLLLQIRAERA